VTSFTGQQFAEGLNSDGGLSLPPVPLTIDGMAKKSGSPQTISFSPGIICKVWVTIPTALVEKVDHLGTISCKDHEHDYVRLHFVNPTTEEGKALTELLKQAIGSDGTWLPQPTPSDSFAPSLAWLPAAMSFGWHPPHIHPPHLPPIPNPIHNVRCAQCIAANMALALAVTAAVATLGPEIGAATAVSSLRVCSKSPMLWSVSVVACTETDPGTSPRSADGASTESC